MFQLPAKKADKDKPRNIDKMLEQLKRWGPGGQGSGLAVGGRRGGGLDGWTPPVTHKQLWDVAPPFFLWTVRSLSAFNG